MKKVFLLVLLALSYTGFTQDNNSATGYANSAEKMATDDNRLTIGGYAQIDYNQPFGNGSIKNGTLDVHRLVLLFGYKFNERVQFITEIEWEHVSEIYVEQAFLEYRYRDWLKFRGGLLLIPFGIINEYHEPPTYNGVERPSLDTYIVPTTWREIGAGATGIIRGANIKYQLYVINGLLSYNEKGTFNGQNAIRSGRQKGIESVIRFPNFSGRIEYYGISGLVLGVSGYAGKSQSKLYNNVQDNDPLLQAADSSVVGIGMVGIDLRYQRKGIQLRGQLSAGKFSGTEEYNTFTGNDFGSAMAGFYLEAGYNVFASSHRIKSQLIPFIRYENYDTQWKVKGSAIKNDAYHRQEYTFGIGWKPVSGVAVKMDYQVLSNKAESKANSRINLGIGVWF
jgi:hypothetical protein